MAARTIPYTYQVPYLAMGIVARPCVAIDLLYCGNSATVLCIVDSGADCSVFHTDVATALLQIDLSTLTTDKCIGTAGLHDVYTCRLKMQFQRRTFEADVQFNPHMPPDMALLGRADFFREFLVGFDEKKKTLYYSRA